METNNKIETSSGIGERTIISRIFSEEDLKKAQEQMPRGSGCDMLAEYVRNKTNKATQ
ncbi:MAG: hypothetical protein PHQ95_01795 [Candidatus Gracilibacteria bacterium]|nr:hypothetical protein [Candidatus Gracilibacteria bacterium]